MPKPQVFVTQFFQLLTGRKFAEAEQLFEQLRNRMQKTEYNKGYLQALSGLLLAQKSNDRQLFLNKINFSNRTELLKNRREFLEYVKVEFNLNYDRGFFSAWAEYMRFLSKVKSKKQYFI